MTGERSEPGHVSMVEASKDSIYNMVQNYFENTGVECWECPHFASWTEPHGERMSECKLLEEGKAEMCPALDQLIAKAQQLTENEHDSTQP